MKAFGYMAMANESENKTKRKRNITLTVVKVEYVQVPDARERLNRVFKILLSNHENEAKGR